VPDTVSTRSARYCPHTQCLILSPQAVPDTVSTRSARYCLHTQYLILSPPRTTVSKSYCRICCSHITECTAPITGEVSPKVSDTPQLYSVCQNLTTSPFDFHFSFPTSQKMVSLRYQEQSVSFIVRVITMRQNVLYLDAATDKQMHLLT